MALRDYAKEQKELGNHHGHDIGHIIAASNGGACHRHNYHLQSSFLNRSVKNNHDCLMAAYCGLKHAKEAVAASRLQPLSATAQNKCRKVIYNGPSAEELVKRGNQIFKRAIAIANEDNDDLRQHPTSPEDSDATEDEDGMGSLLFNLVEELQKFYKENHPRQKQLEAALKHLDGI